MFYARCSKREISNSQCTRSYMRSLRKRDDESKRREDTKRKKDLESRLLDPSLTNKKKRAHLQKELDKLNRSLAAEKNSGRPAKKKPKTSPRTVQANGNGNRAANRKSPGARPSKSLGARPSSASNASASIASASNASASNASNASESAQKKPSAAKRKSPSASDENYVARGPDDGVLLPKSKSQTSRKRSSKRAKTTGGGKSTRKTCSGTKPRRTSSSRGSKRGRQGKSNQSKGKCSAIY